jgi:hypothetical protein
MNIKNRVLKLEKVAKPGGFCSCRNVQKIETWTQDLTEDADDHEKRLMSREVPDVCDQCQKPIEKRQIILQLCDQTTKDIFPEKFQTGLGKEI